MTTPDLVVALRALLAEFRSPENNYWLTSACADRLEAVLTEHAPQGEMSDPSPEQIMITLAEAERIARKVCHAAYHGPPAWDNIAGARVIQDELKAALLRFQRVESPETFNVNWYVRVRLTDTGRAHLRKVWPIYRSKVEEQDGWSRWQLWSLMETFGAVMYLGCEPPFETKIHLIRT